MQRNKHSQVCHTSITLFHITLIIVYNSHKVFQTHMLFWINDSRIVFLSPFQKAYHYYYAYLSNAQTLVTSHLEVMFHFKRSAFQQCEGKYKRDKTLLLKHFFAQRSVFSQNVCCGCCCEFVGTVELYQLDNLWFGGVMRERVNKCFSHLLQTFGSLHVYVNRETCCQTVNNKRWQGAQVWKTFGKRAQVRGFCQRDVYS